MKTTVNYSGPSKRRDALADLKEHLGPERWNLIRETSTDMHLSELHKNAVMLEVVAGVEGYPLTAYIELFTRYNRMRAKNV